MHHPRCLGINRLITPSPVKGQRKCSTDFNFIAAIKFHYGQFDLVLAPGHRLYLRPWIHSSQIWRMCLNEHMLIPKMSLRSHSFSAYYWPPCSACPAQHFSAAPSTCCPPTPAPDSLFTNPSLYWPLALLQVLIPDLQTPLLTPVFCINCPPKLPKSQGFTFF